MNTKEIVYINLIISSILYCFVANTSYNKEYSLMMFYSLLSAATFMGLVYNEIKNFEGIKIGFLLLISYILRLVIPSFDYALEGIRTGTVYFGELHDISDSVFQTILLMNIFYMIVYYSIFKKSKNMKLEDYIKPYLWKYNVTAISTVLFILGTVYNIFTSYIPNTVIPFMVASILSNLTMVGLLLQLLNTALKYTPNKYMLFAFMIAIEIIRTMLFGFMKGPIMYAVSFYIIYSVLRAKYSNSKIITFKNIMLLTIAFLFLTNVIYPFISLKRQQANWDIVAGGIVNNDYSSIDILISVLSGEYLKEEHTDKTVDRLDALGNNAFFVNYTNKRGIYDNEFLFESLQSLVPRFLNKNKHISRTGLMATSIIQNGDASDYDTATSNSYVGQAASAYMIGGFGIVVLLAFFNGWIISRFYRFLIININSFFAMVFFVQLLLNALTGFEEVQDGGVSRCILYIVYAFVVFISNRLNIFKLSV